MDLAPSFRGATPLGLVSGPIQTNLPVTASHCLQTRSSDSRAHTHEQRNRRGVMEQGWTVYLDYSRANRQEGVFRAPGSGPIMEDGEIFPTLIERFRPNKDPPIPGPNKLATQGDRGSRSTGPEPGLSIELHFQRANPPSDPLICILPLQPGAGRGNNTVESLSRRSTDNHFDRPPNAFL